MAKKKPYRFVLYLFFRGLNAVIYILPRSWAMAWANALAGLAFETVSRQRNKTLENLRFAYGQEKSPEQIRKIAKQVFENLAMTGVEMLQFPKLNEAKIARMVDSTEAQKVYDRLLAEGKGLISMTAHLGNWELLAGSFGVKGYKGGVLGRRIYYEPYNRWIVGLRMALKVPTVYRDDSSKEILKFLKRNEIVGLLPDQDMDSMKGIFVPFFGHPAYTTIAPARLVIASGAPMLPNFMVRVDRERYKVVIGEVIRAPEGLSRDEAINRITLAWMKQFEKVIRQYPEQWAWMHNRWKTRVEDLKAKNKEVVVVS